VAKKSKPAKVESSITQQQLDQMAEQSRLANEASARERELIAQQTAQQEQAYQAMRGTYQTQISSLTETRAQQEKYLADITKEQQMQAEKVAAEQNRQEAQAQEQQRNAAQQSSRQYNLFSQRRSASKARSQGVFGTGTSATPLGTSNIFGG